MRDISLIIPYYDNPQMLEHQFGLWRSLAADIQAALSVVVVDDGSPRWPLSTQHHRYPAWSFVDMYRIKVDVRWNWIAARNLGAKQARSDWLFMTDIDHFVPETTWISLLTRKLDERSAYRFARRDAVSLLPLQTVPAPKIHPNTWLMHRDLFNRAGGYDERFSGYYGSDGEFRDRIRDTSNAIGGAGPVLLEDVHVVRVGRSVVTDASTTTYTRKDPRLDVGQIARIRSERGDKRPLNLTFPWERVL